MLIKVVQFSMTDMQSILLLVSLAGFAVLVASRIGEMARGQDHEILRRTDEEFRALLVGSDVPKLRFDGRTAEIVDEHREYYREEGTNTLTLVNVQRFARNGYGEYFFFISEGNGRPLFKHVSHVNAKVALGKKYVEPLSVD